MKNLNKKQREFIIEQKELIIYEDGDFRGFNLNLECEDIVIDFYNDRLIFNNLTYIDAIYCYYQHPVIFPNLKYAKYIYLGINAHVEAPNLEVAECVEFEEREICEYAELEAPKLQPITA